MSLIPLLLSDWEDLERPHRPLLDQNFGLDMRSEQMPNTMSIYLNSMPRCGNKSGVQHLRNLLELLQQRENNASSAPPVNKDDFQVVLDVQQFEPHEIEVKVVDDCLVITAKHEDKRDEHGWVSRQFVRRYKLPEGSNVEQLTSRLSSDGLLTIVAPKKRPEREEIERTIPIERTGKPFVNKQKVKQSEEQKKIE